MNKNKKYPIFEANQVLSQQHLNGLFTYLQGQDRITRTDNIGVGIVSGLELMYPDDKTLSISCGNAITSLGFAIHLDTTVYKKMHTLHVSPKFLNPKIDQEPFLSEMYAQSSKYNAMETCIELLQDTDTSDLNATLITSGFFNDKVIVLLLEANFIDDKNCLATGCDDKGKHIEFILRPLALTKPQAIAIGVAAPIAFTMPSPLKIPRYNIPEKIIKVGSQVLKEFENINKARVNAISVTATALYSHYKTIWNLDSSLDNILNIQTELNSKIATHSPSVNSQYVYDWMNDISETCNEIINSDIREVPTKCSLDALFPFHVSLGDNTTEKNFRTNYFPAHDPNSEYARGRKKIMHLFNRLQHVIFHFSPSSVPIRITPSRYGKEPLSEKSIPFYYDLDPNLQTQLSKHWNHAFTEKGRQNEVYSYANNSNNTHIENDFEPFNFFRIEGHIGKSFSSVITEIEILKNSYSLPFEIKAVNAVDFANKTIDITRFTGRWDDLEADYDMARKRLYTITEFVIKWMELKKADLIAKNLITQGALTNFKNILNEIKDLLTDDLQEFFDSCENFLTVFKQLNSLFSFHKNCIMISPTLTPIAEDLIDRFDDINELFLSDPFSVIVDEAEYRWNEMCKELFLSEFIRNNTGIEHKAGVLRGGTFIIVYVDNTIFKPNPKSKSIQNIENNIKAHIDNTQIDEGEFKTMNEKLATSRFKSSRFKKPEGPLVDPKSIEIQDSFKARFEEVSKTYKPETALFLQNVMSHAFDIMEKIPAEEIQFQNKVIADFFIPYISTRTSANIAPAAANLVGDFLAGDFNSIDFKTNNIQ